MQPNNKQQNRFRNTRRNFYKNDRMRGVEIVDAYNEFASTQLLLR